MNKIVYRIMNIIAAAALMLGGYSNVSAQSINPPSAPVLALPVNNTLVTNLTPHLDWSDSNVPAGTTFLKYELQLAINNTFPAPMIVDISGAVSNSEYTPSVNLTASKTYYWRVRAYNTLGEYSAWSLLGTFMTPGLSTATPAPTKTSIPPTVTLMPTNTTIPPTATLMSSNNSALFVEPLSVQPGEQVIVPLTYITQLGSTGGQPVSVLAKMDQYGTDDNPTAYVSFTTPTTTYIGQRTLHLPAAVSRTSVNSMRLVVNFNGPLNATQKWSWLLYTYGTNTWVEIGSNNGVSTPGVWTLLEFPVTDLTRFISPLGDIRVMLRSSNAAGDAKMDYEAIHFTTIVSATPTVIPPTATSTVIPPTVTRTVIPPTVTSVPITTPLPASAFYVSPLGNDTNPGTQAMPWRTIQKAANTVTAGSKVIVQAGNYPERITLNRSGSAIAPITFEAQGRAVMRGFTVTANYVTIRGFEITNTPDDSRNGIGIWVKGSGCLLENNYIHYATRGGILLYAEPGSETLTANCTVRNNRLYRNSQYGIDVRGRNHLIEGNEIWGTIQHHPGWINSPSYVDADGIHFHGSGHIFRSNYIHDILYTVVENVDAHIDCFQTFKALPYQEAASNITFERNRCDNAQAKTSLEVGKGFMLQNATNIIIRNNLIKAYVGINANTLSNSLTIVNNTFTGDVSLTTTYSPSGISLSNVPNATIKNNIFFNLPGQIVYLVSSTVSAGKNLAFRNDGKELWNSSTYSHVNDLWGVNPMFVSATDFHLSASSPAIDAGLAVSVSDDFDGTSRPRGAGYDIGAFER